MSRRDGIDTDMLSNLIDDYKENKDKENIYKKAGSPLGDKIKEIMNKLPKEEDEKGNQKCSFSSEKWTATCTYTTSKELNEFRTIEVLKEKLSGRLDLLNQVVKTKEYLDEDALEKLIYNGTIKAEDLLKCEDVGKEKVTLRISKKK